MVALFFVLMAAPCEIEFVTRVTPVEEDVVRLEALAINHTKKAQVVSLPERCPGGPIEFSRLDGYDFFLSCKRSPCHDDKPPPQQIKIAPGKEAVLASVVVNFNGNACSAAISPGNYELTFTPPPIPQKACPRVKPAKIEM